MIDHDVLVEWVAVTRRVRTLRCAWHATVSDRVAANPTSHAIRVEEILWFALIDARKAALRVQGGW